MNTQTKNEIYQCEICGNQVEVTNVGGGELICCGEPMVLKKAFQEEAQEGKEKHLPVVTKEGDILKIEIGSQWHPMEEDHFIEWVEVISGNTLHRKYLKPGMDPVVNFVCREENALVRIYCNKHGLWQTEL